MAKKKNKRNKYFVLKLLISGHNGYAILLFVVMLLAAGAEALGLSLLLPMLSGLINQESEFEKIFEYLDFMLGSVPTEYKMVGLLTVLVIAFLLKNALLIAHKGMSANFAMKLREKWSTGILYGYLRTPYSRVLDMKHGIMLNNTIIEPFQSSKAIIALLDLLCKSVVSIVIAVMLFLINWKATLVTAFFGMAIWFLIRNTTYRYAIRVGEKRLRINQDGSKVATESLGAIKEVKMLGQESRHVSELMKRLKRYTTIHTKFAVYTSLPENLLELVVIFLIALVMGYFYLFSAGTMGELLPILGFFIIVGQKLFKYLSYVVTQRMKVSSRLPSLEMIYDWITGYEDQEDVTKGEKFTKLETDILFESVFFSYDSTTSIFNDLTIRLPKRKMTVIVGPSGSGKSTLADLLMRVLMPTSGKIKCNGKDIQEFSLESWRSKIGFVSQDPYLFNITLRENILLGKPYASEEDLVSAAMGANIHDFISSLPEGYDTIVGDRGVKLSGGQRQRVVIARAIIGDPEIFIFDEATSALDREAEKAIQESIEKLAREKTTIVIAHRFSTIEKADVVYDMSRISSIHKENALHLL